MTGFIQVVTTVAQQEDAQKLARALVEARLAACVQIAGPVESVYRWKDQIEAALEWQLWIKSTADAYPALEDAIRRLHPYEVPEILAMPVTAGSDAYLNWLRSEVRPAG